MSLTTNINAFNKMIVIGLTLNILCGRWWCVCRGYCSSPYQAISIWFLGYTNVCNTQPLLFLVSKFVPSQNRKYLGSIKVNIQWQCKIEHEHFICKHFQAHLCVCARLYFLNVAAAVDVAVRIIS